LDETVGLVLGLGPAGMTLAIATPFLVMMMERRVSWTSSISFRQFLQNSTSDMSLARMFSPDATIGKSCVSLHN
jgi:hypothetical protein